MFEVDAKINEMIMCAINTDMAAYAIRKLCDELAYRTSVPLMLAEVAHITQVIKNKG